MQRDTAKCMDRECVGREFFVGGAGDGGGGTSEDVEKAQRVR
jgi:hypothetical protein